ncbi:MAG: phytoene desaturase [Chloroflexota bacterium]
MGGSALVIGAGIGGLATAVRLRHAGWNVTVLEKNDTPGGRCNVWRQDGFTFDTGPTLLLMRDVLDTLFTTVGHNLDDYMDLIRLTPNYRVHFGNGAGVEFSSDYPRMEAELETIERGSAQAFRRYLADAGYKYRVSRERFVERNFNALHEFVTATNLYYLLSTNTLRKLDRHAQRYFRDPRLVAAFTFQTMYLGLAPRQAPAIYSLLPYTELEEGIWFPRGGMSKIVEGLQRLCENLGVTIETGADVAGLLVDGRLVRGVELRDGRQMKADVVVSNADLPYAYKYLVPPVNRGPWQKRRSDHLNFGSSAFLMFLGVDREYRDFNHHDVFLSSDVAGNFDAIFERGELPDDPSFYTCLPGHTDPSMAPAGHESLYVLVPVPHLSPSVNWDDRREEFKNQMYQRLEDVGFTDLRRHVVVERTFTPADFAADYNVLNGSAFGISHGFSQVGYMRPGNKANRLDNLYFVGASTVPGGGVPMVVLGSRLTTERILEDRARA